jgi:hypothetical protein
MAGNAAESFLSQMAKNFSEKNIVFVEPETPEDLNDKEELMNILLQIRRIRSDTKELYERRIAAINPMMGNYKERVGKLRSEVVRLNKKINVIDDTINFLNEK